MNSLAVASRSCGCSSPLPSPPPGIDGLQRPSLDAMVPRLVSADELPAASALSSLKGNLGMVAGPPVAGVLIVAVGLPAHLRSRRRDLRRLACRSRSDASGASAACVRWVVAAGDRRRPPIREKPPGPARFLPRRHERHVLRDPDRAVPTGCEPLRGAAVLGVLYAAPSAGSLLVTLTSGWARHVGATAAPLRSPPRCGASGSSVSASLGRCLGGRRARGGRRRRHGERTVPHDDVEPVDSRFAPRAPSGHRDAELLLGSDARQRRSPASLKSLAGLRASIVSGGALCVVGTVALGCGTAPVLELRLSSKERA